MINTAGPTPGPGEYNCTTDSIIGGDGPAYHMSGKSPMRDLREGFPAPGDYKYQSALSRISYSFSGKHKKKISSKWMPGPGAYDPAHQTAQNWSKGPRLDLEVRYRANKLKEREDIQNPGPASYRHPVEASKKDYNRTSSPAFGFGTSPNRESTLGLRSITPGPGAYEYSPKVGNEAARATIGNAARSSTSLLL